MSMAFFAGASQSGCRKSCNCSLNSGYPKSKLPIVWTLSKNFPHVKTFVCAHDVHHGINLEKVGATTVGC